MSDQRLRKQSQKKSRLKPEVLSQKAQIVWTGVIAEPKNYSAT